MLVEMFAWLNQKVQNGSSHSMFRKMVIFKQVLDFHRPSKTLCRTSMRQNHWSLVLREETLNSPLHIYSSSPRRHFSFTYGYSEAIRWPP
jgi:hypothetical protein